MPGRWPHARPPNRQELAATIVVALPIEEVSLKISAGPPGDEAEDMNWPPWAGVLPLERVPGSRVAANGLSAPDYVTGWRR